MRIAVDARCLAVIKSKSETIYLQTLLSQFFVSQPAHHFVVISNMVFTPALANVTYLTVPPGVNSYFKIRNWYNRRLPAILQQHQIDVCICLNGGPAKTNLPQLVFISSLETIAQKPKGLFSFLYKKYWPIQLQKAAGIITITQQQQEIIASSAAAVFTDNILPIGYAVAPAYQPVDWQQRENITEKYTGGKEYFLFTGPFSEAGILLLLKAFSIFKKRQLSSLQLLIAGYFTTHKDLEEKLATYKYRNDVKLYEQADKTTITDLVAGAYAVIGVSENEPAAFWAAAALQCHVPIIGMQSNTALHQVASGAVLYAEATPENLAEQLKLIYKDEFLRQQLILNAQGKMNTVSAITASEKLWLQVQTVAAKNRPTFAAT